MPSILAFVVACSEDGIPVVDCPAGLQAHKTACIPRAATCADNEVPMSDGTCLAVGVKACSGGLMLPTDGSCRRVGPPQTCVTGWQKDKDGICEPILPAAPCTAGTMGIIGNATCQPIDDCGSGTWGNLQSGSGALHVDGAYKGSASDGSASAPYPTITKALAAASDGATVLVAAGTYKEGLALDKKVTLRGRCTRLVIIDTPSTQQLGGVNITAKGVTLRGLTITGKSLCVAVVGGDATLTELSVERCGDTGLLVIHRAKATLTRSRVVDNKELGVDAEIGAALTMDQVMVRDTLAGSGAVPYGIGVQAVGTATVPAYLTMKRSVVLRSYQAGVHILNAEAVIERSVVRDTRPMATTGGYGNGIRVQSTGVAAASVGAPNLTLRDALVAGNHDAGIRVVHAAAVVDRTVIRDTKPNQWKGTAYYLRYGQGIVAQPYSGAGAGSALRVVDSLVHNNRAAGVSLLDSSCDITRSVIRGTRPEAGSGDTGHGILVEAPKAADPASSVLRVSDSIITGNHGSGIWNQGYATLERVIVEKTATPPAALSGGAGIVDLSGARGVAKGLLLRDALVRENAGMGVYAEGGAPSIERAVVSGNLPDAASGDYGNGVYVRLGKGFSVYRSVLSDNHRSGMTIYGSTGAVDQVLVSGTRYNPKTRRYGAGIVVTPDLTGVASDVVVVDSVVKDAYVAGISAEGGKLAVRRCRVENTRNDQADGQSGMGIEMSDGGTLEVESTLVARSARAHLRVLSSAASLKGSVLRDAPFGIIHTTDGTLNVGADTVFEQNLRDLAGAPPLAADGGAARPDAGTTPAEAGTATPEAGGAAPDSAAGAGDATYPAGDGAQGPG